MTPPNDSPPLAAPDPWGCLVAVGFLALALWLAGCAGRPRDAHPDADGGQDAWASALPDGGRWYAPSWGAARLRARSLGLGRP